MCIKSFSFSLGLLFPSASTFWSPHLPPSRTSVASPSSLTVVVSQEFFSSNRGTSVCGLSSIAFWILRNSSSQAPFSPPLNRHTLRLKRGVLDRPSSTPTTSSQSVGWKSCDRASSSSPRRPKPTSALKMPLKASPPRQTRRPYFLLSLLLSLRHSRLNSDAVLSWKPSGWGCRATDRGLYLNCISVGSFLSPWICQQQISARTSFYETTKACRPDWT